MSRGLYVRGDCHWDVDAKALGYRWWDSSARRKPLGWRVVTVGGWFR